MERTPEALREKLSKTEAAILDAVRSVHYGSVEIVVHDSRVVQIECRKKTRFQED